MFSIKEVLKSKEFEKEAPKGFKFNIRRIQRENRQNKQDQLQKSVAIEKTKNVLVK